MDNFSISDIFEPKHITLSDVLFETTTPVKNYEELYNEGKLLETQSKLRNLFK